jgi:RNA-directed DNA polymerase
VEDRLVQMALSMVLEPIYEEDFVSTSFGFRPGRSAHDALEHLRKTIDQKRIEVIFEADISGFFDNLQHEWLRKFVAHRVADGRIQELINLTLSAGVVEEGKITRAEKGSPQGSPLSPMLANLYLHFVLDLWFEKWFQPGCRGVAEIVRYADDFVVCFERPEEAERFRREVVVRFAKFGLELVDEKTRLVKFGRKQADEKPGPEDEPRTFDFLGFTHYMRQRGKRGKTTARKPSKKRRRRFLSETKAWLRKNMHSKPRFQQRKLGEKLRGFFQYFGLRYCKPALQSIRKQVERLWKRILERRSQRAKKSWERWKLKPCFRLPAPKLRRNKRPRRPTQGNRIKMCLTRTG